MKYFILLTIISNIFISTYTEASQRTSTINCDYCTAQGKHMKALSSAYINDQKIWIIDQQGTEFILDEYVAINNGNGQFSQVDDFSVELISTHQKDSSLSQTVSQAFIASRGAIRNIEKETQHIILAADDEFQSAFQVSTFSKDFSGMMSDRVMNDPAVKSQFDIIDAQIQVLKANGSIALSFLGTSLNLASQVIVSFADGTTVELNVVLTTTNGSNVKMKLQFDQARDKAGKIIPTTSSALPHYREGEVINAATVGNMHHFANWFNRLDIKGIEVMNIRGFGSGGGGGSTSIKDCKYEVTPDSKGKATAKLVCR